MSKAKKTMTALFFHPLFKRLRQLQFLFAIAIFCYMALKPLNGPPGGLPPELLHFIGNVLLMASAWTALFPRLSLPAILALAIAISASAELAQSLTSTRHTDTLDFIANAGGLLFGFVLCLLSQKFLLDLDRHSACA